MGNLINRKRPVSNSKTSVSKGSKVLHKARVLTPADVEANRSSAYKYLTL